MTFYTSLEFLVSEVTNLLLIECFEVNLVCVSEYSTVLYSVISKGWKSSAPPLYNLAQNRVKNFFCKIHQKQPNIPSTLTALL